MNELNDKTRRHFIKNVVTGAAVLPLGGILPGFNAKSYASQNHYYA